MLNEPVPPQDWTRISEESIEAMDGQKLQANVALALGWHNIFVLSDGDLLGIAPDDDKPTEVPAWHENYECATRYIDNRWSVTALDPAQQSEAESRVAAELCRNFLKQCRHEALDDEGGVFL